MKKLLILSGKGGTGKTTTASAFIHLAKARAFADVDVEVPNLHLVSDISHTKENTTKIDYFGSQKSCITENACVQCGLCFQKCRFGAISKQDGRYYIDPYACEGCGVCQIVCKHNAIEMKDDKAGEIFIFDSFAESKQANVREKSELVSQNKQEIELEQNKVDLEKNSKNKTLFVTAKLKMGRGNSGKLVSEVKKNLFKYAPETDLVIIDGSPGIGCPVIASINGVDLVLLVVEPSLSGMSDMKRLLKTLEILKTKALICINKFDTNLEKTKDIEDFCAEYGILMAGKIPYDKNASLAINTGRSLVEIDCPASTAMKDVFTKTCAYIGCKI